MKKLFTLLLVSGLFLGISQNSFAQENHGGALNAFVKFGSNSSISANYEFQVAPNLTVSPEARIWFSGDNDLAIGGRVDYYFDSLFNLPEPWDIWGGADAGFVIGNDEADDFSLNLHAGVEYKFNDMWGLIFEFGGGTTAAGGLGVGIHF